MPMQVRINGAAREVGEGTTVAELVRSLGLIEEQVAVELNEELVARDRRTGVRLAAGDRIEVVTLVGGG